MKSFTEQKPSDLFYENIKQARSIQISINPILPVDELIAEATRYFNKTNVKDIRAGKIEALNPARSIDELSEDDKRQIAAFVRHFHSNYDQEWKQFFNTAGGSRAHFFIKKTAIEAFNNAYPEIATGRQIFDPTYPLLTVQAKLPEVEKEELFASLSQDELVTIQDALSEEFTLSIRPVEDLIDDTNKVLHLPADTDHFSPARNKLTAVKFYRQAVREALKHQSNFETIALTYLHRPGFALAWTLMYEAVVSEFAEQYPRLQLAFKNSRNPFDHDWKEVRTPIKWTTSLGEQREETLSVITTTYRLMTQEALPLLDRLEGSTAYADSLLKFCLEEYTNFTSDFLAVHGVDMATDPVVDLHIRREVLRAISKSHPLLRDAVNRRIKALEGQHGKAVLAETAVRSAKASRCPEEEAKKKARINAMNCMLKPATPKVATGPVPTPPKPGTLTFTPPMDIMTVEEQAQEVRNLVHNHPDKPRYQAYWMKLPSDKKAHARLMAEYRLHYAVLAERPDLAEGITQEVQRREKQILKGQALFD